VIIEIFVRSVLNGFIVDDDGLRRFRQDCCVLLVVDPSMAIKGGVDITVPLPWLNIHCH